jgi:hypothetical protein
MTRFTIALAVLATALAGMGVASAAPDDQYCSYTLSTPQRFRNGNADAVIATLQPQQCNGRANARRSSVCLASPESRGECGVAVGWAMAKVVVPWVAGRTYTATGNGCADNGIPFSVTVCTPSGPITATL